jgi:uncharacterized protein (DUF58 family)
VRRPLAFLLATAALVAAAGAAPAPALFPLAVGLTLVTVAAWTTTMLAVRRVVVTRTLGDHEAREHEPIRMAFDVARLGRLPVALEIQDGAGRWIPLARAGALTVPRRGAYRLAPSELRVRDWLGIAQLRLTAGRAERLLILPAPEEGPLRAPASGAAPGDPEPDGLQAYTAGIPVGRIHWPAMARGAGLHARRVSAGPRELPLVVVDTSGALEPGAIDWAARTAAGAILRLARHGGCRVWLPGDRRATTVADTAAWRALHRRLAVLEPAPATSAPPEAIRIAAALAGALPTPLPLPRGVAPSERDAGPIRPELTRPPEAVTRPECAR